MKTISSIITLFFLSALITLAGCGGGGGSTPAPAGTTATVKLSTQGTLAQGTKLAGIDVVITLPAGMTVSADANNVVAAGVVTVSGVALQTGLTVLGPQIYTPATATTAGKLEFTIAAGNFGVGEFATVNFNLATGSSPLTVANVTILPADQGLNPVTTLHVALS